jgi:uncharacterized membrane protein
MGNTSLGLDENIEALFCYLFGWVTGIIFLILEKENKFVRFHAMQSLITFLFLSIVSVLVNTIPFIGWLISPILCCFIGLILWVVLMYKAFKGEKYKLPFAGEIAEQQINK